MDSLFEVVIIALILLAPLLEALFRKRKEGGDSRPSETGARRRSGGAAGAEGSGERSAADEMVPDDLWELITGERRHRPAPAEPRSAGAATEEASSPPESVDLRDREERTEEGDRATWISEPPPEAEPEVAHQGAEERPLAAALAETEEARIRRRALRETAGTGPKRASLLAAARTGRLARRGAQPAADRTAHPLVGELDRRALRRAVVWREILGPPVSQRDEP